MIWFLKGATAYEIQIGRRYVRIVHMRGPLWPWYAPWRRVSFHEEAR